MEQKIIVVFKNEVSGASVDLEVPVDITANELIYGLNKGYALGINMNDSTHCFLRSENPIALIRGEDTLESLGLHNGSTIIFRGGYES